MNMCRHCSSWLCWTACSISGLLQQGRSCSTSSALCFTQLMFPWLYGDWRVILSQMRKTSSCRYVYSIWWKHCHWHFKRYRSDMDFLIRVLSTDSFWPIASIWLAGSVSVCTVHYHFSLNFVVFLIGPAPPLHSTCMTGSRCISSTLEFCRCRWTSRLSIYTKGIDFYLGACHKTLFSWLMILLCGMGWLDS